MKKKEFVLSIFLYIFRINSEQTEKQVNHEIDNIMINSLNQFCGVPQVIFVVGGPACGKETICNQISKEFNYTYISTGSCLKEEIEKYINKNIIRKNIDFEKINECIEKSELVPDSIVIRVLRKKLQTLSQNGKQKILIDGFPRNYDNIDSWKTECGSTVTIKGLIQVECSDETMIKRAIEKKKNDEVAIKKRLSDYKQYTYPIIAMFESQNKVFKINGECKMEDTIKSIEEIFTIQLFEFPNCKPTVMFVLGGPGSGKGVQCKYMAEKYKAQHLSIGDCLREEVNSKSEDSEVIKINMDQGLLVSQEIVVKILRKKMIVYLFINRIVLKME